MKSINVLIAIFIAFKQTFSHYKSHLTFMIVRHGARSPGEVSRAYKEIGVHNSKQLTPIGDLQLRRLGEQVRKNHFLEFWEKDEQ